MHELSADVRRAFDLTGRTAVVVGAGSVGEGIGIGRACALLLAECGARVGVLDARADAAQATLDLIKQRGGAGLTVVVDVADHELVARAIGTCVAEMGGIDILVNNVGIVGPQGDATQLDVAAWTAAFNVNVTAMVSVAQHVIPSMRERGGGAIVNMSSIAGLAGGYPNLSYATTKGAIANLTRAMAAQHGRDGIRVNAVAPGQLFTPRISARQPSAQMRAARAAAAPLGTEGTAWDAAYAVLYLCCDASRWISGVILSVDAGLSAVLPLESPSGI
jgi:NAD(P)-dependent dehydrogenase (short-subunit alcohol dehydrogenase family)